MSIFIVPNKNITHPMQIHKVTDFLSEISAFLRKDDVRTAMYSIMDVTK